MTNERKSMGKISRGDLKRSQLNKKSDKEAIKLHLREKELSLPGKVKPKVIDL